MKSKYIIGILLSLVVMACNTKEKNLLVDVHANSIFVVRDRWFIHINDVDDS